MKRKLTDKRLRKWVADKLDISRKRSAALFCLQYAMYNHQKGDELRCFYHLFWFHFYRDEILELMAKQGAEQMDFDVEAALVGEGLV